MTSKFQGYPDLEGPENLSGGIPVRDPISYFIYHLQVACKARGIVPWNSERCIDAYVNHGRWVSDCVHCKFEGMLTRPTWGVACCGHCGARYGMGQVNFPPQHALIAEVLCMRMSRLDQNWRSPGPQGSMNLETVDDLIAENVLNDIE